LCLYSIGDNNSFLTFNRDPVNKMIDYLTSYFKPDVIEEGNNASPLLLLLVVSVVFGWRYCCVA